MEKQKDNTSRFNMRLEDILDAVVEVTGIAVEDIVKHSKKREYSDARTLYYEVARRQGYAYAKIGEMINRKHSGVMVAVGGIFYTPEFKAQLERVLNYLGINKEPEVEIPTLWSEDFKIVDISSRYFGSCFMGIDNGEVVAHGCRPKVINAMLDRRERYDQT